MIGAMAHYAVAALRPALLPLADEAPTPLRPEDIEPSDLFDPGNDGNLLLSYLAWGASAAGVAGTIIIGMQLAMQLRRGEMGEGATYFRGMVIVLGACVIAATAGPIVEFLGPFGIGP